MIFAVLWTLAYPMVDRSELIRKLREFPQFGSHDGIRWYQIGKTEAVCQQAADLIEELEKQVKSLQETKDA